MADRCACKVAGCLCRREAIVGKCTGCASGEHANSRGRILCHLPAHRAQTVVATHRVLFTEGKQTLCCYSCAQNYHLQCVPTWPLNSESERQRERLLEALAELYSPAEALKWIQSRRPQLPGTALVMHRLGTDAAPAVFALVDQLRSGAHA